MKKNILKIIPMLLVLLVMVTPCILADSVNGPISSSISNTGSGSISKIVSPVEAIYGSAIKIIKIAAFSAIIFAGVRYMFASADSKAEIKEGMINLAIGSTIIFGVTNIIDIVVTIVSDLL